MPTQNETSAAVQLGELIRKARKSKGCSLATLAEEVGRPREWVNRIELGYSQFGEYKPPSAGDLQAIVNILYDHIKSSSGKIFELGLKAESEFKQFKKPSRETSKRSFGKLTQTEVILGERQIVRAIISLIEEQYSDAIIRNTGVKGSGGYIAVDPDWEEYRQALGKFLEKNPNALFKRLEYASNSKQLIEAKSADIMLAGTRKISDVHNARVKFQKDNPLQLHFVIGQREAIMALPQVSGFAGSNAALLIRDKIFVEALRTWYDEVLWNSESDYVAINFSKFEEGFANVADMYNFSPD